MADERFALALGGVVAHHALAGHDLGVQVVDALVELGRAGGVRFLLGRLVVEVEPREVELPDQVLQFFVHIVLAARRVQLQVAGVSLQRDGGFFEKIDAIHVVYLLFVLF